ncbi:uncharacterized protein LDX57_000849 [Aspergillus melleus]|uniref:uncharacterized protein n=1 Tax=Aspergillus melleus TaxID=138277 RepID=UPI001E8D82FD|nr:uncharacterized protein LDX57_000849 [Aspergillus melleus]KAH8423093.1 hypothetical protein LDX57_000849 [Aspergillus melleus]
MASSIDSWIAPLIEKCLSVRWKASEVEDDGSNLRFVNVPQQIALINGWATGDKTPTLNVTDFRTQIDAILSRDSIETFKRECPNRSFDKDTVRGLYLKLLDFEVVFEYSISQPKLHLYVTRFEVAPDERPFKGPPQGKGIKRTQSLQKFMRKVFSEIKSRERNQDTLVDTSSLNQPPQTQANGVSHVDDTQDFLASQVQPMFHAPRPSTGSKNSENGSTSSNKLLGLLESNSKSTDPRLATSHSLKATSTSTSRARSIETERSGQAHSNEPMTAVSDTRGMSMENMRKSTPTLASQSVAMDESPGAANAARQPSMDEREQPSSQPRKPDDSNKRSAEVAESVKDNRHSKSPLSEPEKNTADKTTSGTKRSPNLQESRNKDPWDGMTKIHRRDVTIPKNQAALFEQHNLRWVPPATGDIMPHGHVPPPLLEQWNDIAYQRSRLSKAEEWKAAVTQSVEQVDSHEPSPDASSSSSESDSDGPYSWDGSPERDVRPRQQLPADSSPAERRPPRVVVAQAGRGKDSLQSNPDAQREQDPPRDNQNAQEHGNVNGVTTATETQPLDVEDAAQDRQPVSDEESDDSMMDTSVPCPLGAPGSQQSYFHSQSEVEFTSSGPSLPAHHEQVQVVETPAGHFNRHQPANANKDKAGPVASSERITTTPQAKSSSQSRVLNTYASNLPGTQDTQGFSNAPQGSGFHEVDIMATQLSNGSWQPQNASPHLNMAVPASTSQSDGSSKPFSSHNEVLSSNPSGESAENASDIPNSAQDPPVEHTTKLPLKRFASELDVEEQSPAKRHHPVQQARVIKEPTPSVIFRRQSYIGGSSNHVEAQRIYEKFRSDYPLYAGDFLHFTELCFKLRAIRAKGDLKRSFLWDDFVIQHLKEYQQHVEQTQSQDAKSQEYEEYFASNFSRPSFKKRSLTADGIEVAASQYMPAGQTDAAASPAKPQMGTSFTGSLADKFSNLQAHSFGPSTQGLQSDTDDEKMSATMSSPTPYERTKWYTPDENLSDRGDREDIQATNPEVAEREQDTEHDVAHEVEGAGAAEVVGVETNSNAHPQDVEMAEVEVATGAKDGHEEQEVTVESIEVEILEADAKSPGMNEDDQRRKDVEMTEVADEAEETRNVETAAEVTNTSQAVEIHRDAEESKTVEIAEAANVSHNTKSGEVTPDVEDTTASKYSRENTDDAEDTDASGVAEVIDEADVIQETQEYENTDESDQEDDFMDETHETASIELGDSGLATGVRVSEAPEEYELLEIPASDVGAEAQAEAEAEPEIEPEGEHDTQPGNETEAKSINEGWFRSLRHIYKRPAGPVWSDDYNTPFKKWARADQNVLKERQRRGGAHIPVDEKGVIQRFKY